MELLTVRKRDLIVLAIVVLGGGGFFGYAKFDIANKRDDLYADAAAHEKKLLDGIDPETIDQVVEVTSGKSYGYFGNDWGVIRILTRAADDGSMDTFNGVEYFYEYQDGRWNLADTASIKQPEFIYESYRKFEEEGYTVDEDAYLRYNR